jgi:hypothetical protein
MGRATSYPRFLAARPVRSRRKPGSCHSVLLLNYHIRREQACDPAVRLSEYLIALLGTSGTAMRASLTDGPPSGAEFPSAKASHRETSPQPNLRKSRTPESIASESTKIGCTELSWRGDELG